MGSIFNDPSDKLVSEFELHDMGRFDEQICGGVEDNERARSYQQIAKTLRDHIEAQKQFCSRDFYKIRHLKKDLACVFNDYENLVHEHRRNVKRLSQVEQDNSILVEQKNKEALQPVQLVHRLEWEIVELRQSLERKQKNEPLVSYYVERLEWENAELRQSLESMQTNEPLVNNEVERLERENAELRKGVEGLQRKRAVISKDIVSAHHPQSLEVENIALIEHLCQLSNALVQVSLEHDNHLPIPDLRALSFFVLSIALIVVIAFYLA